MSESGTTPGFLGDKVRAVEVGPGKSISQLLQEMSKTGFQGRKLAEATDIIEQMIKDDDTLILMGYAGSMSTTGQWRIINWLLENHYVDILVPTGANISEDIVDAMGAGYWQGPSTIDGKMVFDAGYNRYYDVYGREDDYLRMTELIADFICTLEQGHIYSSREFLHQFGLWLDKKGIDSIVATAARNSVPVFCPAIADSPYGDAALIAKSRGFDLKLDAIKDYVEFMSLNRHAKKTGVIYLGGGVPKDFIQLFAVTGDLLYADKRIPDRGEGWTRVGTDEHYYPHEYAVQITLALQQDGGLSGCTFEEATSWGKESPDGRLVQCFCDTTIALPIIAHALAERIGKRREGKELSKTFE